MIPIIEHVKEEGPGTIAPYFHGKGFELKQTALYRGDALPDDFASLEAVICMGGPMNVYEEDKYPFLRQEDVFIKEIVRRRIPFLGICLGSQLLAKACGARVTKSPVKEVGWHTVKFTPEARRDVLFSSFEKDIDVYHWHEDMFAIPSGAAWLATGEGCPHQAFRAGAYAYGLQFHIEVDEQIIVDWTKGYREGADPALRQKAREMLDIYAHKSRRFHQQGEIIFQRFAELIERRKRETV